MDKVFIENVITYQILAFLLFFVIEVLFIEKLELSVTKRKAYIVAVFSAVGMTWYDVWVGVAIFSGRLVEDSRMYMLNKINVISTVLLLIGFSIVLFKKYWKAVACCYFFFTIWPSYFIYNNYVHKMLIIGSNNESILGIKPCSLTNFATTVGSLGVVFLIYFVIFTKTEIIKVLMNVPPIIYKIFIFLFLMTSVVTDKSYLPLEQHDEQTQQAMFGVLHMQQFSDIVILGILFGILIGLGYMICKHNQSSQEVIFLREKEELQYASIRELENKEFEIRKMNHDISNHIKTMSILMDHGDMSEAKEYLNELCGSYNSIKNILYCENKIINAVMIQKIKVCDSIGIKVDYNIRIPSSIGINEVDLMSVLSNLLDNAIEACQLCESDARMIDIQIYIKQRCLVFKVMNTKNNSVKVTHKKNALVTSKKDKSNHGYGTRIIGEIARRYDGYQDYKDLGEQFQASVMLQYKNAV